MNHSEQVQETRRMGVGMMVLAWLVALALGVYFFGGALARQVNPNPDVQTNSKSGVREVVLKRNKYGHYVATGAINRQPVVFMLDTGATGVAIPQNIAQQLKLQPGRAVRTQTANGVATSYAVTLSLVGLGDIELKNVRASIAPGLQTEQVLLGMSFLKHIEFTQRGDSLILRQYP